ncbi:MAG: F0F1 ATP synthase subunit A [Oligoflexia bacterium]|nr:F0F1 ATP synthase subunit A [Oligoflexia bacterium]MBF0367217.1 F0F1 ATP synthase subunit A [Oligoflexia bacterium]
MRILYRSLLATTLLATSLAASASDFSFFSLLAEEIHIPEHTITFAFIALLITVAAIVYRLKLSKVQNIALPDKGVSFRNLIEVYGEFIYSKCVSIIGEKEGPKHFWFIAAIFLIILSSNLIGLIPGFLPPTANFNTTFALGLLAFFYYTLYGCKTKGVIGYFKHFMGPLWYMAILLFPIELVSDFIRPLTLAVRLRGNMFGDHLVLGVFTELTHYIIPVVFLFFGLLVSFVQAFVFCILTMVYISLAIGHGESEH